MPAAVCWFWGHFTAGRNRTPRFFLWVLNDGFLHDIIVTVLYMSYGCFKLQPQYYGEKGKFLTVFFYLQSSQEVGRRPLTQKEWNNGGGMCLCQKRQLAAGFLKCPQMLTHYYTILSFPDAGGRTKWKRMSEENENRAKPFKISLVVYIAQILLSKDLRILFPKHSFWFT